MSKVIRAVIWTQGGPRIGLGHVRRCLTLAQALTRVGVQAIFAVNADDSTIDLITRAGFEAVGICETLSQLRPDLQILADRRASVLIADSYDVSAECLAAAREHVKVIVALDDQADHYLPVDIVVNAAVGAEKLPYATPTAARLLLGPAFALLREEFAGVPERPIHPKLERLLITVGGSDEHDLTRRLVEWARQVLPNAILDVVIGPFFDESLEFAKTKVTLHRNPQTMRDLMLTCDLALCGGGQTTYELAATGTPAIAVQVAGNQMHNLAGLERRGTLVVAGSVDDESLEHRVKSALRTLAWDVDRRLSMSQLGRTLVDGRGAERVAEAIVELARARETDERL